ncbi:cytochrome b/b6 domain-containing protein [Microvirga sp. M2]|uniref:cytochrome b/b6 domain-containing protein n=1 Tax=Microvirga sp. M2 TaxID=3073270 RepID=UPI0039C01D25
MSFQNGAAPAGGAMPPDRATDGNPSNSTMVRVWDPFIRLFHWGLVGLFGLAFVTGDEAEWLHLAAGYATAGLIMLRILWGFIGTRHARFADFVRSPRATATYLSCVGRGRAPRYLGHNPAGGAMVLALLAMITAVAITGFMMTTDAFWGAEWVEDLHEGLVYLTLGLVGLHVTGVVLTGLSHSENLVKAMVTGRKRAS